MSKRISLAVLITLAIIVLGGAINNAASSDTITLTAQDYLEEIQKALSDPDRKISLSEVIFIGEVLSKTSVSHKKANIEDVLMLPIKVVTVETEKAKFYLQQEQILLRSICGENMQIGEKYIISAKTYLIKAENGKRLKEPRMILYSDCTPFSPFPLKDNVKVEMNGALH